ncbi:endonuclease VII domain-containing protein [Tsukamurella sp. 1534]|uniref:endonuclease VII domain-containing protein n=1 Tax=Tsukamurella sp. 1534 TaxID=1151061 RepID=UPI000592C91A|nr:endonuclease VII domain-containing protein [Tsukamurella sp. 1534]
MTTTHTPRSQPAVACKDCLAEGITTARPLAKRADGGLQPGPRCATHHREKRKAGRRRNAERRDANTYGLAPATDDTPSEYDQILEYQGGCCAICGPRARGITRRLSVDHDHKTGAVRGLLCDQCNRIVIGRYNPTQLGRAIAYLAQPPAPRALGRTVTVPTKENQ